MQLGWSHAGRPDLRAGDTERDEVRRVLAIAGDEGHLDAAEYATRSDAVASAVTRADLAALTADLRWSGVSVSGRTRLTRVGRTVGSRCA